ncbi:MAG TPA: hypothetical protein VN924_16125 [Bryobacteraceae bacterium]|nr:hypothetical protein [Bryobacteraceae bacterium]
MKTIAITGALLALSVSVAPYATACSLPGVTALKAPAILPPGLIAVPAQPNAAPGQSDTPIVGLWSVTFYSSGIAVDQAFDAWHSDGTEILNDFTDPIEGNVCLGVWTQTGPQTFKLKHPSWTFDTSGNLTGTAYILETVTVGPGGNEYEGPYSIDFYDTSGNPTGSFTGNIKAYRIMPE